MKARIFVILESVCLGIGLLIFTPSINSMTGDSASVNAATIERTMGSMSPSGPKSHAAARPHPLAVWTCTSSWYGEDFDGRETATGEAYNMYGATAAHPTLPLGSIVRVVNTKNHRSQVVRINDRGPYVGGRELDVSYEVARRLGFDQSGLAHVRLELLEVPPRPAQARHN